MIGKSSKRSTCWHGPRVSLTEPAGGTTLASAIKLIQSDVIAKDESIVICVTGNGYKTAEIMAATVPKPITLGRTLNEFEAFIAGRQPN